MPEERTTSSTGGQKGVKLERFDLIPAGPLRELAILYGQGARKYDPHQWRNGYEWSKSFGAMQRHAWAWQSGLEYDVCSNDPEGCSHVDVDGNPFTNLLVDACYNHTGVHHLVAVAWHSFVLLEYRGTHPEHDDRWIPERAVSEREEEIFQQALRFADEYRTESAPIEIQADMIPAVAGKHKASKVDKVVMHYTERIGRGAAPVCGIAVGSIGVYMTDFPPNVTCQDCANTVQHG